MKKTIEISQSIEELIESYMDKIQDEILLLRDRIKIKEIKFLEFDSGNMSHANAYFEIVIEGKPKAVKLIVKYLEAL